MVTRDHTLRRSAERRTLAQHAHLVKVAVWALLASLSPVSFGQSISIEAAPDTPTEKTLPVTSAAKSYPPAELRRLAASFLTQEYAQDARAEIQIGHLDPRVGVKICSTELSLVARDPTGQGGAIHVQVSCDQPVNWTLYVPGVVTLYRQVPIASSDLLRGQQLTDADFQWQEVAVSHYRYKIVTDINQLLGQELKRNLGKGAVFTPATLAPPTLVRRGELVQITADTGGISINVEGTALGDGRLGESVRVRNNQSQRIIAGTVIASRTVKVN